VVVVVVVVVVAGGGAHIVPLACSYPDSWGTVLKNINIIYEVFGLVEILWVGLFIDLHDILFLLLFLFWEYYLMYDCYRRMGNGVAVCQAWHW